MVAGLGIVNHGYQLARAQVAWIYCHEDTKAQRFQNYLTAENTESAEVFSQLCVPSKAGSATSASYVLKAGFRHRDSPLATGFPI